MTDLVFEWDERKNRSNRGKHGVSFEEARTAFFDENARVIPDPEHSSVEERFLLLGLSTAVRILVVGHCYKESDRIIRIFSARRADRDEQQQYHWWIR